MEWSPRKVWLLMTVSWAAMVFNLSRTPYSSTSSGRLIATVFSWLSITVLPLNLGLLNTLLRKSAHVTEYAILAVFLYNTMKPAEDPSWSRKAAIWALLASGGYSLTDEFHQQFVPGRHASPFDCLIDTMGALLGLLMLSTVLVALRPKPTGIVAETTKSLS
jgi:VanZ family protein